MIFFFTYYSCPITIICTAFAYLRKVSLKVNSDGSVLVNTAKSVARVCNASECFNGLPLKQPQPANRRASACTRIRQANLCLPQTCNKQTYVCSRHVTRKPMSAPDMSQANLCLPQTCHKQTYVCPRHVTSKPMSAPDMSQENLCLPQTCHKQTYVCPRHVTTIK